MSPAIVLPPQVLDCMNALEDRGFAAYAVGGCVRDALRGAVPQDYDLCTAASPEAMKAIFAGRGLVLAGEKHGTVGVVTADGVVEITAFRAEAAYSDHRHPDSVRFVADPSADLARRDFTVNAMAYSPRRGLLDPFGGREDLEHKRLRAVGDPAARFQEDALRILRGVRFSASLGLEPEEKTLSAMLALRGLLDALARERVFQELDRALPALGLEDLLRFGPILAAVIPELEATFDFDQRSPHHAYSLYEHIARVTAALPGDPALRWAGLLHDTGKPPAFRADENGRGHFPGHAALGAQIAEGVLTRLRAPAALRERVCLLIREHMTPLPPDKKILRRRLGRFGEEAVRQLLALQRADFAGKGTPEARDLSAFDAVEALLRQIEGEDRCFTLKDLRINGNDLISLGFSPGPGLGRTLDALLNLVQDEALENSRGALLAQAEKMRPKEECPWPKS